MRCAFQRLESSAFAPIMDRAIAGRLGAACLVVQQAAGTPSHKAVSRVQAHALAELLKKATLTPEALVIASERVAAIPWHGSDKDDLLMVMLPPKVGGGRTHRSSLQNYMALPTYFNQSEWDMLVNADNSTIKLQCILGVGMRLCLRNPSEPTMKFLASFWAVVAESPDMRAQMSQQHKIGLLQYCKQRSCPSAQGLQSSEVLPGSAANKPFRAPGVAPRDVAALLAATAHAVSGVIVGGCNVRRNVRMP